jgi:PAS domain S-box-containing protein
MGSDGLQWTTYSALLIVASAISVASIAFLRYQRRTPWFGPGNALLAASAIWTGSYALELVSTDAHTPSPWRYAPLAFAVCGLAAAWGLAYRRHAELLATSRRLIAEGSADPTLVLDAQDRIVDLNAAGQRLIPLAGDHPLGRPLIAVWPAWAELSTDLRTDQDAHRELTLDHDEERTYDAQISPVTDGRGRPIGRVIALHDVTDLQQAEREVRALREQLLQARKMEAIGTLAGGIAHDFNNLLTAIQGNATLAKAALDPDAPVYVDLNEIELACRRASRLTHQLLLFSRKQPAEPTILCLNEVVGELLEMLQRLIGEDVSIDVTFEPDLWTTRIDKGSIEQVMINLVVNARDAMPQGGQIAIETRNVTMTAVDDEDKPEARPRRYACLSVTDTGIGIDDETIEHIFEPFFSTKEQGQGTGLGLAVVYGVVQQYDGWIEVESQVGQGSTFTVYLPAIVEAAPPVPSPAALSLQGLTGRGERILLVEDEKSVREFAARVLEQHGYVVTDVPDAGSALETLEREEWGFDLVFADVVLPDKNGLELAEQILARNPSFHVLLSSGYTGQRSRWETIRQRGLHFLQKPYTLTDLLGAVRKAMD